MLSPLFPSGSNVPRPEIPIKSEPEDIPVLRKRRSSLVFNPLKSEENVYPSIPDFNPPPAKTVKLEHHGENQMPLHASNWPRPFPLPPINKSDPEDADRLEDRRERLDDVRHEFMRVRRQLTTAEIKRRKTKADETRTIRLRAQVAALRRSLDAVSASIPSLPAVRNVAVRSELPVPPPFHNPAFASQCSAEVRFPNVAVARYTQPVASGSNIKSEPDPDSMDEDQDDDWSGLNALVIQQNVLFGTYGPTAKADE